VRQETLALIEAALDAAGAEGLARTAAAEELTQLVERAVAIEAAELRAAVTEWGAADAAVTAGMDDDVSVWDFTARCVRFQAAVAELRRLAASEGRGK